jgi:hypothetical protein
MKDHDWGYTVFVAVWVAASIYIVNILKDIRTCESNGGMYVEGEWLGSSACLPVTPIKATDP